MTLKISLLFLLALFVSCGQQSTSTDSIIVPKRQKPQVNTNLNEPPPPPPIQSYYLPSNFIIDTAGQVYFYQQQQYGWFCGTGIEWDTPPEFIDLKPKDIIQLSAESIDDFVKLNILPLDSNNRLVAIASINDTIHSVGLSKIIKALSDKTKKIKWTFRKATQEEATVLAYKQQNRKYYADNIKWDSTKIRFVPKLNGDIKFMPQKIEDE